MYGLLVLTAGEWNLVFQSKNQMAVFAAMGRGQKFAHILPDEMKVIDLDTGEILLTGLPVVLQ